MRVARVTVGNPFVDPVSIPGIGRRNIGQLTNVLSRRGGHAQDMEIRIELLQLRPLAGRVRAGARAPDDFAGWLALLALLERLVEDELASPADGLGGELYPRGETELSERARDVGPDGAPA